MIEAEFLVKLKNLKSIIAIVEFGSFRTEEWIKDRSDIDLLVITAPNITFMDTLEIEDEILEIAKEFYNYPDIHLTFILFNNFSNKFARIAIDSEKQYILNDEKWYDFTHNVLKYIRNNEKLSRNLKLEEKYQSATDNLSDLKVAIKEYNETDSRIIRRAMFAFFQDFTEYIVDMCESYILINDGKIKSSTSATQLVEKAHEMGFFDNKLKQYLVLSVRLRNRYTHDYYLREDSEKAIEEFCFVKLANLEIFLEESKDKVFLKYKKIDE
ncbi:nucleotidyltransferase domain-containing protein [Clostridium sp. B9]|uniref:nucleotidyltransferase domain-containing protein n=1 Tax=Clostridium sp. B9 TaxID=3423224 RepID=UPI003D2F208E